jgi:hypothetical protein
MAASGKSLKYLFPYPLSGDVVDVSGDIQLLATRLDTTLDEIIQDVTGLMISTGNTETGISVTYDDATAKLNFALDDNYLKDTTAPVIAHDDHIGVTATYDAVLNKTILEVTGGGGGSGGSSNASLSDMWWLGV